MTNTSADDKWYWDRATQQIHMEQLKRVELFNGRAAMLGIVIGIITEGLTGAGYAACRTQFLPFCF